VARESGSWSPESPQAFRQPRESDLARAEEAPAGIVVVPAAVRRTVGIVGIVKFLVVLEAGIAVRGVAAAAQALVLGVEKIEIL
jgi:hypothetical protein